jgi:hypothetical protein
MARIRILRPNVSQQEAVELLAPPGPSGYLRDKIFGRLQSVAEFYVPFRLFQVEISNRGISQRRIFALDVIAGSLDLYEFETLPEGHDIDYVATRNYAEATLSDEQATEILIAKVQRILYLRGFFRLRNLRISAHAVPGDFHIPYWIGFRGHGERARVVEIDALRRRAEGAKVRGLLCDWLNAVHAGNCGSPGP